VAVRLLFSAQPDLALELDGFVQEVVGSAGTAWIVGRVRNRSGNTTAPDTQLAVTLPAGYSLEGWEGDLASCAGVACSLGALAPGEVRGFRLRLASPGIADGVVQLAATTSAVDFPTLVGGVADSNGSVSVSFNAVHTGPPPATGGGGGGGGATGLWPLLVLLGLGLRRRR
jgi:MYXO-CTERM domain-containing protein